MRARIFLSAFALNATAAADFLVLTDAPASVIPTDLALTDEAVVSSLGTKLLSAGMSLATAKGESWLKSYNSAATKAQNYIATVTSIEVPVEATDPASLVIYTTVPEWYTKLPKDVHQYYEDTADLMVDIFKNEASASLKGIKLGAGLVVAGLLGVALL